MNKPKFLIQAINSNGTKQEPELYEVHELLDEKVEDWSMSRRGFIMGASVALAAGIISCKQKIFNGMISGGCDVSILSHSSPVISTEFSSDGKYLESTDMDAIVRIWDMDSGNLVQTIEMRNKDDINTLRFSSDSKQIISTNIENGIKIWEITSGNLVQSSGSFFQDAILINTSPDNKILASATGKILDSDTVSRSVQIRDIASGKLLNELKGNTGEIKLLIFSQDGKSLASIFNDKTIKIWKIPSGKLIKELTDESGDVHSVIFSPDGNFIAAAGKFVVKIWGISSGKTVNELKIFGSAVTKISFSPDGKFLAAVYSDKTIRIWDVSSGKQLTTLSGHTDTVSSVSFSPDGKLLASGSYDKTVKIWDIQKGEFITCLFDPSTLAQESEVITYTSKTDNRLITRTIIKGSIIPEGSICTCNTVKGSECSCVGYSSGSSSGGSYRICTCVPVK